MGLSKISLAMVCLMFSTLAHLSLAQNSPKDFLAAHNAVRARVGVPPLAWSYTIAKYAQEYANKRRADCNLEHSGGPYGENIAESSGDLTAAFAVDLWAGEKKNYDYKSNSCGGDDGGGEKSGCLHYTQIVWRDSKHLGCGTAQCQNGWTFVTCNYDPPGNYIGQRPY